MITRDTHNTVAPGLVLKVSDRVLLQVIDSVGQLRAETGGALGGSNGAMLVEYFHFDESSRNSAVTYSPDYKLLNTLFKSDWNPRGIRLCGFVHSHPWRMNRPSFGDEVYAERILTAIEDMTCLVLPIVNTIPDTGEFRLTPWAVSRADRGVKVERLALEIVADGDGAVRLQPVPEWLRRLAGQELPEIVVPSAAITISSAAGSEAAADGCATPEPPSASAPGEESRKAAQVADVREKTFGRVRDAYDLDAMFSSRIVCVGAGGAASFIEDLARAGVGQFVLIDPDTVSETNLATQQTYRSDLGRPKVDCIAMRVRDINPMARTVALQKLLDDLDDAELERLLTGQIDGRVPKLAVLCGLTDSFWAQARVNRLALQFGVPSLCAQVYREGRGAEVTFTYPGVTPACHRCILSSRYKWFLDEKQKNPVTSHGTPIFATTRLNAIKGFVTLALLHHRTDHPRWGGVLKRIGRRNLIQIRMDPDFSETLGFKVFDRVLDKADRNRLFFDETVWLPEDPECPETGYPTCPDCGGTGNLTRAKGTFGDTREMRPNAPHQE